MPQAELLWQPTDEQVHSTRMHQFMQTASEKHGFEPTWAELHRWSIEHRDQFWGEMWTLAGIETVAPARVVCAGEGMLGTKWFPGLTFNFAAHLLRFDDDRIAIEAEDERGRTRTITYRSLRAEVARLAGAMRAAGLASTPMAMISRGVCGVRGRTLIVNLPGSERGARENLETVLPVLDHAVLLLRGGEHRPPD